jgi:hypothetical protein
MGYLVLGGRGVGKITEDEFIERAAGHGAGSHTCYVGYVVS